jgi:hypothetical protein
VEDPEGIFGDGSLVSDETGQMSVISLMHHICFGEEIKASGAEESQADKTGRYSYLMACRTLGARPIVPALMMMSGKTMLLNNYGMQAVDAHALARGLESNKTLTDVDINDNPLGEGSLHIFKVLESHETLRKMGMRKIACG